MTDQPQPDERRWRAPAVVLVALLAIVLVVTGGVALITGGLPPPGPSGPTQPSPPPTQPASADGFPTEMLGLPVVSVGVALDWANSGQANGRAMAVRGWWLMDFAWSCPAPMRNPLPIEGNCTTDYLSSAPYALYTCTNNPDGSGDCHGNPVPPGVQVMPAMMLQETAGTAGLSHFPHALFANGVPVVVILHVGDLRSRQCPAGSQETCAGKALVDSVAWAGGDQVEGWPPVDLVTALAPEEVIAASGLEGSVLSAFAVRLGEAWMIDPRFHGIGDDPVWVVRGISSDQSGVPEDPSRAVDVSLVDDATGSVLFAGRLAPGADYRPARLLVQATEPADAAGNDVAVYYRVESTAALPIGLVEDRMDWIGQVDETTARWAAVPALMEPDSYDVIVWRALSGDVSARRDECRQRVSLAGSGGLLLEAAFPDQGACQFVSESFVNPFNQ